MEDEAANDHLDLWNATAGRERCIKLDDEGRNEAKDKLPVTASARTDRAGATIAVSAGRRASTTRRDGTASVPQSQ